MFKTIALGLAAAAAVFAIKTMMLDTISGEAAKNLVRDGALLVDVRSTSEYADGHIQGALNIPVDQIESRAAELGDHAATVVVYCRSGQRSARAQKILKAAGFETVHNLGGKSRWPD